MYEEAPTLSYTKLITGSTALHLVSIFSLAAAAMSIEVFFT